MTYLVYLFFSVRDLKRQLCCATKNLAYSMLSLAHAGRSTWRQWQRRLQPRRPSSTPTWPPCRTPASGRYAANLDNNLRLSHTMETILTSCVVFLSDSCLWQVLAHALHAGYVTLQEQADCLLYLL